MWRSSGIGTYLQALLPRVRERLADVQFSLLVKPGEDPGIDEVRLIPLKAGIYSASEQFVLPWHIPASAQLIWSPHINLPILSRKKKVVTVHDAFYLESEWSASVRWDKRFYTHLMMHAIARQASLVMCVSEFTRQRLEQLLPSMRAPIHAIPNAVDRVWFEPVLSPSPHPRPYLVAIGNVKPHKNLARVASALASLGSQAEVDLVLVGQCEGFAGSGGLPEEIRAALGSRLHFTGFVSGEDLRRWVGHAEALVFPSLYEGFGLPPLEAMAVGTPVLASRFASIPEVCGPAAEYVDATDIDDIATGLKRLLGQPQRREELVNLGRTRVLEFDWDRSADETAELLHRSLYTEF